VGQAFGIDQQNRINAYARAAFARSKVSSKSRALDFRSPLLMPYRAAQKHRFPNPVRAREQHFSWTCIALADYGFYQNLIKNQGQSDDTLHLP